MSLPPVQAQLTNPQRFNLVQSMQDEGIGISERESRLPVNAI